ncbi:MAG: ABC transporter ATP-binding protein [Candidatus Ratteibacteria bacterium]|jgi:putative ABC transport system ATP-binding protein
MKKSLVITENLSKIYEGSFSVTGVEELTISVPKGAFFCLAGPSGSGKSTLLKLLGGIERPSRGRIYIEGKDLTSMSRSELSFFRLSSLGFVFQELNLISVLTARENVEFGLMLRKFSSKVRREKVMRIMEELGIEGLAERRPSEMSGGQQQRVAVARAVVGNPLLLLADEPTANLDSHATANLIDLIRNLNISKGITCILASHDEQVLKKADKILYLRDGKVSHIEQPEEL